LAYRSSQGADDAGSKHTIKEVMKIAHKDGLLKKIVAGMGSKDDARQLVDLYQSLGRNKPPKGEAESWKEKTTALAAAAQDVVDEKEGSKLRLQKAADCANCHNQHKGK